MSQFRERRKSNIEIAVLETRLDDIDKKQDETNKLLSNHITSLYVKINSLERLVYIGIGLLIAIETILKFLIK